MKIIYVLITFSIVLTGCATKNCCVAPSHYLKKVNLQKPYFVHGKYCITPIISSINYQDSVLLHFKVYDRITGQIIPDGVIFFNSDSVKVFFVNGIASKKLKAGTYNLGISSIRNLTLIVDKLNLKPNSEIVLTAFLGNSVQW